MGLTPRTKGAATVAEQTRLGLGRLTPTERRVGHVLLASYPVAGLGTVSAFARRAQVSAPTVLRFIARLGFASYPEFQRALRDELEQQAQSPLGKPGLTPAGAARAPALRLLERFHDGIATNLAQTFRNVPPAEFEAVVALLADPRRRVLIIGGRFTDALAQHLSAHLRVVRPGVAHVAGQGDNWRDQLLDMGGRDVVVVFDIRRYAPDLARFAAAAARRHVSVVLFTDQWLSPVARDARHVLAAHVRAPSRWDSIVGLLALAEAVLASVTELLWPTAEARLATLEAMREALPG